jgi:Na+(H+)/acetate symporter ActP
MNPLSLILGFLPLIAFSVLAGRVANNGIGWGALVALVIALINMAITPATVAAEDHQPDIGRPLPRADPDRVLGQPQRRRLAL